MGRDIAEAYGDVMELWKKAERISRLPLRDIYWDGDDNAMADTRHLQPALTVANFALWMRLSAILAPQCAAGHSLGEYSALAAAGVLSIDTVLELVSLRGRLMSEADPEGKGAMAALLKLTVPQAKECVAAAKAATGEEIVVANYNTPAQTVVSGARAAIARVREEAGIRQGRAIPLPVSGAFHSPLMREAAAELATAIEGMGRAAWKNARFSVYPNASATGEQDAQALRMQLVRQMTSSVHWTATIANQWDSGARVFVECGPKGVLSKMVEPILKDHPACAAEPDPAWTVRSIGNLRQLTEALG
jgi:[acyl-carrier-protein] S-malonyltransferase